MHSANKIPGYTGYVPYRSEFFGNTVGVTNKQAQDVYRSPGNPEHSIYQL